MKCTNPSRSPLSGARFPIYVSRRSGSKEVRVFLDRNHPTDTQASRLKPSFGKNLCEAEEPPGRLGRYTRSAVKEEIYRCIWTPSTGKTVSQRESDGEKTTRGNSYVFCAFGSTTLGAACCPHPRPASHNLGSGSRSVSIDDALAHRWKFV